MAKGCNRDIHNALALICIGGWGTRSEEGKASTEEATIELNHKEQEGAPQKES